MQTIGEIIDKLTIVNLKIYHEEITRHSGNDQERLRASDKICILNNQRCALKQEIDEYFLKALSDPSFHNISPEVKNYKVRE